jgi:hypothetical protein
VISTIGATSTLVIASELYDDLFSRPRDAHFPLPPVVKLGAMLGFLTWSMLEARKVRQRLEHLI